MQTEAIERREGRTAYSSRMVQRLDGAALMKPRALVRRATGLGWFSIGLGLAELVAPRSIARLIGARDTDQNRLVLRGFGAREIAAGLGILSGRRTAGWIWARLAGDALDLAALGRVTTRARRDRPRAAAITAAVAGVTAMDLLTAVQLTRNPPGSLVAGVDVKKTITVNRSPAEVYAHWRNLENLPRFMSHLESVTVQGPRRSTWRAKAPLGTTVEWEAEITEDVRDELIAWRSVPGASVPNGGSVRFRTAPGNRGTEIHVHLKYDVPGGVVAKTLASLFGEEPSIQVGADLRRFKQFVELGDTIDSDASVHVGPHPGRPSVNAGGNGKQVQP